MTYRISLFVFLLSAVLSKAEVQTETVEYFDGDTPLVGHVFYDDALDGERPGVLVVHEWWGLNENAKSKATALAEAGYIAMALDMYGEGKTTQHPDEAGAWSTAVREGKGLAQKRFRAAYDVLAGNPRVDGERLAAIGYCFGGHVVLSMAQAGLDLRAVASFHGALPTDPVTEEIVAKVLVCHGAADPFVSHEDIRTFQENMNASGADWQFVAYGGVKHSFTSPDASDHGIEALAYSASADRRSWKAMLALFDEAFSDE